MAPDTRLRKSDYYVAPAPLERAQAMVREHHYAKGGSNTAVYVHGLFRKLDGALCGIAWWLPPRALLVSRSTSSTGGRCWHSPVSSSFLMFQRMLARFFWAGR